MTAVDKQILKAQLGAANGLLSTVKAMAGQPIMTPSGPIMSPIFPVLANALDQLAKVVDMVIDKA
jgi:hypothetical protein